MLTSYTRVFTTAARAIAVVGAISTAAACSKDKKPEVETPPATTEPSAAPAPAPKPAPTAAETGAPFGGNETGKENIRAFLKSPRTAPELMKHVSWLKELSYGPCELPEDVSKVQFLGDILTTMEAALDTTWSENSMEDAGEPLYTLGKYGYPMQTLLEKYYDTYENWEGGIGCFDSEPFGEALAATWEAL